MSGARWVDHVDHPCSITEHHAHHALGSSSLRRYLTDQQPTGKAAGLGNAVGWLAVTPEERWRDDDAKVLQRQNMSGHPGGVAAWEAEHPGVIGLTAKDYAIAVAMASQLRDDPAFQRLLSSSLVQIEHTVLARHVETGILCKARPDFRVPGVRLLDLKITRSNDPFHFVHSVGEYGYDAQAWLYSDIEASRYGLEQLADGYDLVIVTEAPPHKVAVWSLPSEWIERGRGMVEAALQLRRLHQETGVRPPLWWQRPRYLPGPSWADRQRLKEIREYTDELLRLRDRADARAGVDGEDPRRRTA